MLYYSLNGVSPKVDFRQATINGQAPDKGLYFPETINKLSKDFIDNIEKYSNEEIAYAVIAPYVGDSIPTDVLKKIIKETISFEFPLHRVTDNIYSLELFHGPTLAFKDVGARFMARCLGYFLKDHKTKVTVLVATSGDTGGAVADGFYEVEGIDVVILYPSGKVSPLQEMQLTTHGKNISALEVNGTFDDCQKLVKQAFGDDDLTSKMFLTSANSINVARWLPQQFYYFFAWKAWKDKTQHPVISVPSGNFGNICAGTLAKLSGLPLGHFIAACNVNDVLTDYFNTGNYKAKTATPTISNAMDVGDPSNMKRMLGLMHDLSTFKDNVSSFSCSDAETKDTIARIFKEYNYIADPHGAVGFLALERYLADKKDLKGIFLETAHPLKFSDVMEPIVGKIPMPQELKNVSEKKKFSTKMEPEYEALKSVLLSRLSR